MANQNQHIVDYLNAYGKMADTDFAVMITGPWGCGKTHFIKQHLKDKNSVYVSLNGVADASDIDIAVFKAIFPLAGSKPVAVLGKLFNETLKAGLNFNLADTISLSDFKAKIGDKLLVFDDLERCLLEPEKILGYINAFVESGKVKVIIIGEEKYLNEQSDEKYSIIKEKVIGKTFHLTERIEDIFGDLISTKVFPHTHGLLTRSKDIVIRIFKEVSEDTGQYNYRALKHCFRDFEFFYSQIDPRFCTNADFLEALLKIFLTLDYELQLSNITLEDIENGAPIESDNSGRKSPESAFSKILRRHDLKDPHFIPDLSDLILPRDYWVRILRNDGIEHTTLFVAIKNTAYFPNERPEWTTLWYWRNLEDDAASEALAKVREKLNQFEYRSREVILHVFSILLGLAEMNAVPENKEDIFLSLESYLENLRAKRKLDFPKYEDRDSGSLSGAFGLGYWKEGEKDFARLVGLISDAIDKAIAAETEESVKIWLKQLSEYPGKFYPKLGMNAEFCREPVLHLFPTDQFIEQATKIPNAQKWQFNNLLISRFIACSKVLVAELPFLVGIIQELDKRIVGSVGLTTPTTAYLKYLRDQLNAILPSFREMATAKGVDSPSPVATIET